MKFDKVHLSTYLKESGNFTKSKIKKLIEEKRVLVNKISQPLSYIVKDEDIITVDNNVLPRVPKVYYLYNKPVGVLCNNESSIKESFTNYISTPYRVFCVGRLDKDSRGLIILTNDGQFSNQLTSPSAHIEKEYIVKVKYPITEEFIINMRKPVELRGKKTLPAVVLKENEYTFKIILKEGKYRQIRRMVIHNHNTVLDLQRIRIGNYQLEDLKEGSIKQINIE